MLAIYIVLLFFVKANALATVIVAIVSALRGGPLLGSYVADWMLAWTGSFALVLLDAIVLYPRLRSPLRHLPIVPVSASSSSDDL